MPESERPLLFEERMWVPWWAYMFVAFTPIAALTVAIGLLAGGGPILEFVLFAGGFGGFMVLVFWWAGGSRTIRLDDETLRLGYGDEIRLQAIERIDRHDGNRAVRVIRRRVVGLRDQDPARTAAAPALLLGRLGAGLGQLALAGSGLRRLSADQKVLCPQWMPHALLVLCPSERRTTWLIGTRRPDELEAALRDAASRARRRGLDSFPEPLDRSDLDLAGGWLPPNSPAVLEDDERRAREAAHERPR